MHSSSGRKEGNIMTEMELFEQNIPMIAEMVVEARKMDRRDYENWKKEMLEAAAGSAK